MQITKVFSSLPSSNNVSASRKIYATQNENILFSQNLNDKLEITKQTENITSSFDVEIEGLIETSIDISENAQLLSCCGASSLSGIAFSASSKCFSLVNSIRTTISSYSSEIAAILNNGMLSENEKNSKIQSIITKIKALIYEAKDKAGELYSITHMLKSMTSAFIELEKAGKSTSSFLIGLKAMVNNYNTSPTDLSDVSEKNDIYNKIKDNENLRLGKNTCAQLKDNIAETDKEIKDIEQKLKRKDTPKTEKAVLEKELLIHKSLKRVYELFT